MRNLAVESSGLPGNPQPGADVRHLPTRDGYDRWAAIYDGEGNPLVAMEEPHVDALLGDVRGLRILDLGCGTGRHSLRLARRGAIVTGVDFSEGMLRQARAKASADPSFALPGRAEFIQHDLSQSLPLADASFDRVLCGLVLDHIQQLEHLFGEMKRLCHPNGSVVVSIMHPAMMLRGVQARFTDPATGVETRPASVPNQISDYVMAASRSGLTIDHLSEHAVDAELSARVPRAEKYLGWPLLLMMRCR